MPRNFFAMGALSGAFFLVSADASVAAVCEPEKVAQKYPSNAARTVKLTASPVVPPFTYSDPKTMRLTGLETEIVEYAMNCAGLKFEWILGNWNAGLASLSTGGADVMLGNVNHTVERASRADFVVFMRNGTSVMVQKGNPKNLHSIDDLCGVTGAVGMASSSRRVTEATSKECVGKGKPPIDIQLSDGTEPAYRNLINSRVDFVMETAASVAARLAAQPDYYALAFNIVTENFSGPVVVEGNNEMAQALLNGLKSLDLSGQLAKLMEKYGIPAEMIVSPQIKY